jgi:hypothetical protein
MILKMTTIAGHYIQIKLGFWLLLFWGVYFYGFSALVFGVGGLVTKPANWLISKLLLAVNWEGNSLGGRWHLLNLLRQLSEFGNAQPSVSYLRWESLSKGLTLSRVWFSMSWLLRLLKDFAVLVLRWRDFELFKSLFFSMLVHMILE